MLTRSFTDFTTYLLTRYYNLPQDVKPRDGNAYSTRKGKGKKGKGRGKGNKGKGYKGKGKGRSLAFDDEFEAPAKRPRLHERQDEDAERQFLYYFPEVGGQVLGLGCRGGGGLDPVLLSGSW